MPAQPGQLVVWKFALCTFMVGFRKNGQVVLTCIEDGDESIHANEEAAHEFAKGYSPRKDQD